MIFVPLPFVVSLLLVILLTALIRNADRASLNRPFLALIALCVVQSFMVGLRWGYHLEVLRYVMPVLAACVPPLTLASFHSLAGRRERNIWQLHWLPPVVIAITLILAPSMIDLFLSACFIGYAIALMKLGETGPDGLNEARLDRVISAYRAIFIVAGALCLSAMCDLAIALDFEWTKGRHAALIVGYANLLGLLVIGMMAVVAASAKAVPESVSDPLGSVISAEQDREILAHIERLLVDRRLFLDENLSLSRLSRRAGIPARQISGAINRLTGRNVSQYINDYRIAEACRLLRQPGTSITAAMLESGFQTKSNFNREFRRVMLMSPSVWRQQDGPS